MKLKHLFITLLILGALFGLGYYYMNSNPTERIKNIVYNDIVDNEGFEENKNFETIQEILKNINDDLEKAKTRKEAFSLSGKYRYTLREGITKIKEIKTKNEFNFKEIINDCFDYLDKKEYSDFYDRLNHYLADYEMKIDASKKYSDIKSIGDRLRFNMIDAAGDISFFRIKPVGKNNKFTLEGSCAYPLVVDWGDGTKEIIESSVTHSYTKLNEEVDIKIKGVISGISINRTVSYFILGENNITNMDQLFSGCNIPFNAIVNTKKATSMKEMFLLSKLWTNPVMHTSNVTNMEGMFQESSIRYFDNHAAHTL